MDGKVLIRDVALSDYDQWRPLWDQYNEFYGRSGDTALSEDVVQSTWQRFFDEKDSVHGLVAECEGRLAGMAHFIFHRNTITIENTCYLQDLFSAPALRGKGVGRALIMEFYEKARQAGTRGVYWHTRATNDVAMQLYDRVATNTGFVVYRANLQK